MNPPTAAPAVSVLRLVEAPPRQAAKPNPRPNRKRLPRQLRLLVRWRLKARAGLRELGGDYTSLCALDELVERLNTVLWHGPR